MKCEKCKQNKEERELHESHDVPLYLFFIEGHTRPKRKRFADRYKRRWLCMDCHIDYEVWLRNKFIELADKEADKFFGDGNANP